jgi:hypothetical protein
MQLTGRHRTLAVAGALALATAAPRASALVFERTPERIIIATDSLRQKLNGDRDHFLVCKIRQSGSWAISVIGVNSVSDNEPHDFIAETAAAIEHASTLADAERAIRDTVLPALKSAIAAHKDDLIRAGYHERQSMTAFLIARWVDGAPVAGLYSLDLVDWAPSFAQAWFECPGERLCPDGLAIHGFSVEGPLMQLVKPPYEPWVEQRDAAAARRLIELQIDATPDDVRGPIDVLQIDVNGARWVDPDPASQCATQVK